MEKEKTSILQVSKSPHFFFDFHLNNYTSDLFIHDLLGMAKIPLIGKYNKNDYTFDKPSCLISLDCTIKDKFLTLQNQESYPYEGSIYLPEKVIEKLLEIPEKIKHNKGSLDSSEKKENNKFEKKSKIFDFHPFKFVPFEKICFSWGIFLNQTKKIYKYKPKKEEIYKNIILHPWLFPEFDFSKQKRVINNIPSCLINCNNGVESYCYDPKAINFNQIRSEYISLHLKSNSLCFSPNNMRLVMDEERKINDFFLVFLREDNKHFVFYYWVVNQMQDVFENVVQESQNIEKLIENLGNICGEGQEINLVKNIFGIKK